MPRLTVLTAEDAAAWEAGYADGSRPELRPYGLQRLEAHGFDLLWPRPEHSLLLQLRPLRAVRFRAERRLARTFDHHSRIALATPAFAWRSIATADACLALFEDYTFTYAALRRLHLPPYRRVPIVGISCWAAERLAWLSPRKRNFLLSLMRRVDHWLVLSSNQVEIFGSYGLPATAIAFGVSTEYFAPSSAEPRQGVVAVGKDSGRDFATLVEALRGTNIQLTLVCPETSIAGIELPPNVQWIGTLSTAPYRDLLCRSAVSVVVTKDLAYPTGQTVLLESMAAGAACVVSDTEGLREYTDSGRAALLVFPADAEGLRDALTALADDEERRARLSAAGRALVEERFSTQSFAAAVASAVNSVVAR